MLDLVFAAISWIVSVVIYASLYFIQVESHTSYRLLTATIVS